MLVVGTYIVVSQMNFFQRANMGFVRDGVITTRVPVRTPSLLQTLEDKLRAQSFVQNVSFSYTLPGGVSRNDHYTDIGMPEAENEDLLVFEYVSIDSSFLNLYQIKLLAGRNLAPPDSTGNIIINNKLVKNLKLGSPQEAVGRQLKMSDGTRVTVVGVIDDYYSNSLKEAADNIVMVMEPEDYAALSIKFNLTDEKSLPEMVASIGTIWSSAFPDYIFNYRFLDENIADYYRQEQKYADLFQLFSVIFLLIGCLGLYGLITFAVNRKGKEVAIRKVLGASLSSILSMFSREYVQLIILSFVLAAPVAWYVSKQWLTNFANHITMQWWLFLVPGMLVLVIAIIIIGAKSIHAAGTDPVKSLRSE
jgi:ABC-type antimicrobial peptide transport system permease subunit